MLKFYFQIKKNVNDDETFEWDQIPANDIEFKNRNEAIRFAENLVKLFKTEVRMTENQRLSSGSYFRYQN